MILLIITTQIMMTTNVSNTNCIHSNTINSNRSSGSSIQGLASGEAPEAAQLRLLHYVYVY